MASGERRGPARFAGSIVGCLVVQGALTAAASAAAEEAPDLELLAYLGSWPETDEEWVAVAEWDGRIETQAPEDAEPPEENDDE